MDEAIVDETVAYLRYLSRMGCTGFDPSAETLAMTERWESGETAGGAGGETLDEIRAELGDCRRCRLSRPAPMPRRPVTRVQKPVLHR